MKKNVICIFPNDPIQAYFEKGEIKERYFNPQNMFSQVHIISTNDKDIEPNKVKEISGNAELFIHVVGKVNLKNYKKSLKTIQEKVVEINPDIIRSYNPLIQGWLAANCAKKIQKPLVVSLHINYDKDTRSINREKGILHFLKMQFTAKNIEPFVLQTADRVICVHESVSHYAKDKGAKKIDIIYNRVNLKRFSLHAEKTIKFEKPTIIYVARLAKSKNHEVLIKAIENLDVILLLIGNGPNLQNLKKLISSLHIENKVKIFQSIPNSEIHKYYASADIFAAPVKDKGVGITFLEAMASGLPTIIRKVKDETEEVENAAYMVKNDSNSFRDAIKEILSDKTLREKLQKQSLQMAKQMDGEIMEQKEADLYRELLID